MSTVQFNRRCRLVVQSFVPLGKGLKSQIITDVSDLRMSFKHKKSWHFTPNVGNFTIYNLSSDTRGKLKERGGTATLYAGYGNDVNIVGTISARINHKHNGTEWESKLEGGDGGRPVKYSRLTKSYSGKTPVANVVNDFATQLDMPFTTDSQTLLSQALAGKQFKNGYSSNQYAAPAMRDILLNFGLTMSIQDNQILLLTRDGADGFKPIQQRFVLGPDSGLVGSPEYASPPHPGKPQLLRVKCLLQPLFKVGSIVTLNSRDRKGDFKVWVCEHEGDTHGGNWYTTLEVQALAGGS
jgi:hypothetical protein